MGSAWTQLASTFEKSVSDSIVLHTFKRMGQVSGERLVACCNQIIGSLTPAGIKFGDNAQARIREITRYANSLCPPDTVAAGPVSLRTIYNLMDQVEEKGLPRCKQEHLTFS